MSVANDEPDLGSKEVVKKEPSVFMQRILKIMESAGLDVPDLAFSTNLLSSRIHNWKSGTRNPDVKSIGIMCEALKPYYGDHIHYYVFMGKNIDDFLSEINKKSFTKEHAVTEMKSLLKDALDFGKIKLSPGFKPSELVKSFSDQCSKY